MVLWYRKMGIWFMNVKIFPFFLVDLIHEANMLSLSEKNLKAFINTTTLWLQRQRKRREKVAWKNLLPAISSSLIHDLWSLNWKSLRYVDFSRRKYTKSQVNIAVSICCSIIWRWGNEHEIMTRDCVIDCDKRGNWILNLIEY